MRQGDHWREREITIIHAALEVSKITQAEADGMIEILNAAFAAGETGNGQVLAKVLVEIDRAEPRRAWVWNSGTLKLRNWRKELKDTKSSGEEVQVPEPKVI